MGPAAAAQVGMDAMNVALNPGSSATSALGAVGREGEVQEVAGVLVDSIQSAITNAISPFLRQQQAAIEAVASGMTETKRKIRKFQEAGACFPEFSLTEFSLMISGCSVTEFSLL